MNDSYKMEMEMKHIKAVKEVAYLFLDEGAFMFIGVCLMAYFLVL